MGTCICVGSCVSFFFVFFSVCALLGAGHPVPGYGPLRRGCVPSQRGDRWRYCARYIVCSCAWLVTAIPLVSLLGCSTAKSSYNLGCVCVFSPPAGAAGLPCIAVGTGGTSLEVLQEHIQSPWDRVFDDLRDTEEVMRHLQWLVDHCPPNDLCTKGSGRAVPSGQDGES